MLRVDTSKWGQSREELRRESIEQEHPRTRERFAALYEMSDGLCPTRLAQSVGRHAQTLISWVKRYNEAGPQALHYRHTGGTGPFARPSRRRSTA